MIRIVLILCLCASAADAAIGDAWARVASRAPGDVDVLVVVRQASALGDGAAGETLTTLLTTIVPPTTTLDAWNALAGELRLPPDEAFNALLGNRVIFAARRGEDDRLEWAIESEVDAAIAEKLLVRLGARPKDIRFNKAVALIENGRFQITSERRGKCATLVFSPTDSRSLFVDLLARMSKNGLPSLAEAPGFRAASKAAPPDSHVFVFLRSIDGEQDWVSVAGTIEGDLVRATVSATVREDDLPKTPFGKSQWKALSRGRLVAIVEPLKALDLPISWLLGRIGDGGFGNPALPIDGRIAITVDESPEGGVSVGVALETPNVDQLAPIGDAMIASVASEIAVANRSGAGEESFATLAGLFPEAARTISLSGRDGDGRPQRSPLGTEEFILTWSYPTTKGCQGRGGWWIVAGDRSTHDAISKALTATPRWDPVKDEPVSYLLMRPARLQKALQTAGLLTEETATLSRILALIESIEGHTVYADGLLRGEMTMKLGDASSR